MPELGSRLAGRCYRWALRLAPRAFRERFGPEAQEAFDQMVAEARARRGGWSAARLAAAACGDAARIALAERAPTWRSAVAGLRSDAGQALRLFRREPLLALAITVTLALATGPAVAVYNALVQLVLAPLPYRQPDRLVVVAHRSSAGQNMFSTAASVIDYRAVSGFAMVGGIAPFSSSVTIAGSSQQLPTWRTTGGLLSGMGVPFAAGRDFTFGEPAVVVTRGFALARFGSEAAAIGKPVVVDRQATTIVGVLAVTPVLPRPGVDLFVPHPNADAADPARGGTNTIVIARLADGVPAAVAETQARAVARSVTGQRDDQRDPVLLPLSDVTRGSLVLPMTLLFAAAAALFLIAVASISGLVLARAAARAGETAVRLSLGASRWRLWRAWLCEGAVLACPGVAFGTWLSPLLVEYGQSRIPVQILPLPERTGPHALIAAGTAGLVTTLLFAAAPVTAGVLRSSLGHLREHTGLTAGLRRARSQAVLIVAQVAMSVVLFTITSWLALGLHALLTRPMGFNPDGLVVVSVQSALPRDEQLRIAQDVVTRLAPDDDHGTATGALAASVPGLGASTFVPFRVRPEQPLASDRGSRPRLSSNAVSANYFRVMGVPLLRGRLFSADDEATPGGVIVISRSFAARWFPDGALGREVSFGRDDRRRVVGVVEDVHADSVLQTSEPQYYVPMSDPTNPGRPGYILLRTRRSAEAIRAEATALVHANDPGAVLRVSPAAEAMALPLAPERLAMQLIGALAAIALLFAAVNVYALAAFSVAERRREIGIRIALGARPREAARLVMRRSLFWTAVGLATGATGAAALVFPAMRHAIMHAHPGTPRDVVLALAAALTIMALGAGLAAWLPARRAAAIDPAEALRSN